MYSYVCIHIYIYICMYVDAYKYIYICSHMRIYRYEYIYMYIYIYMDIHICMCVYTASPQLGLQFLHNHRNELSNCHINSLPTPLRHGIPTEMNCALAGNFWGLQREASD